MRKTLLILLTIILLQACKAQQVQTTLPKIDNYTKGALEIRVVPFGLENPITVGKIKNDGSIHFDWNSDISSIEDTNFYMSSIKNAIGMTFCNKKEIIENNKTVKVVDVKNLFLYKNGQQVGSLYPATQQEIADNVGLNRHSSLVLGSELSWIYSNEDGNFKATCSVNMTYESSYNFKEITNYNIQLKKGWNMIESTLVEKQDWKNENDQGSLPKTITKTSIVKILENINWYIKYWGE